jgi:hypothetical protein
VEDVRPYLRARVSSTRPKMDSYNQGQNTGADRNRVISLELVADEVNAESTIGPYSTAF